MISSYRCGGSFDQIRERSIVAGAYGTGAPCPSLIDDEPCALSTVNCVQTSWSAWGACTGLCGSSNIQSRTRETITQAVGNGTSCGALIQTQQCANSNLSCSAGLTCYPLATAGGVKPTCIDVPASYPQHECQVYHPCGLQTCVDILAPGSGHACVCNTNLGYSPGIAISWGGEGCIDANACISFPCSPNSSTGCHDLPAPYYLNNPSGRTCGPCNDGYTGDGATCLCENVCVLFACSYYPCSECYCRLPRWYVLQFPWRHMLHS